MTKLRYKGTKTKYNVLDAQCIGRTCLVLGMYQHRSMCAGGGSRNTGSADTPCCMTRAYRGCPDTAVNEYSGELAAERKREGLRQV